MNNIEKELLNAILRTNQKLDAIQTHLSTIQSIIDNRHGVIDEQDTTLDNHTYTSTTIPLSDVESLSSYIRFREYDDVGHIIYYKSPTTSVILKALHHNDEDLQPLTRSNIVDVDYQSAKSIQMEYLSNKKFQDLANYSEKIRILSCIHDIHIDVIEFIFKHFTNFRECIAECDPNLQYVRDMDVIMGTYHDEYQYIPLHWGGSKVYRDLKYVLELKGKCSRLVSDELLSQINALYFKYVQTENEKRNE